MKVYNDIEKPCFIPFTVSIQLESQEEVDTLAQLCNYVPIVEWAEGQGVSLPTIRRILVEARECNTNTTSIHAALKSWMKDQCNLVVKNWG